MADFNFVSPRLATGAALNSVDDVAALITAGVTHVIDCRDDFSDGQLIAEYLAANPDAYLHYLWNGTPDDGITKSPTWFARSIYFASAAFASEHISRHHLIRPVVYAHCAAGVNRGPSTAYGIMRSQGFAAEDAERYIRFARPQVGLAYKNDADIAIQVLGFD